MSNRIRIVTLAVSLFITNSWAAPLNTAPPAASTEGPALESDRPLDDNLSLAKPALLAPPPPLEARYYAYREALTFRAGLADAPGKNQWSDHLIGFEYLFPKFLSPKIAAGADLHSNGVGHIYAGERWFYRDRDFFRPSVALAVDNMVNSADGLATFASLNNYYIRAAGTVEYVVWDPLSVRLELAVFANLKSVNREITLGLSRGW